MTWPESYWPGGSSPTCRAPSSVDLKSSAGSLSLTLDCFVDALGSSVVDGALWFTIECMALRTELDHDVVRFSFEDDEYLRFLLKISAGSHSLSLDIDDDNADALGSSAVGSALSSTFECLALRT